MCIQGYRGTESRGHTWALGHAPLLTAFRYAPVRSKYFWLWHRRGCRGVMTVRAARRADTHGCEFIRRSSAGLLACAIPLPLHSSDLRGARFPSRAFCFHARAGVPQLQQPWERLTPRARRRFAGQERRERRQDAKASPRPPRVKRLMLPGSGVTRVPRISPPGFWTVWKLMYARPRAASAGPPVEGAAGTGCGGRNGVMCCCPRFPAVSPRSGGGHCGRRAVVRAAGRFFGAIPLTAQTRAARRIGVSSAVTESRRLTSVRSAASLW